MVFFIVLIWACSEYAFNLQDVNYFYLFTFLPQNKAASKQILVRFIQKVCTVYFIKPYKFLGINKRRLWKTKINLIVFRTIKYCGKIY